MAQTNAGRVDPMTDAAPKRAVEATGITKTFGGTQALAGAASHAHLPEPGVTADARKQPPS